MSLGTIIAYQDTPNSSQAYFVVNDQSKGKVKKGVFVQITTEEGTVIGRVDKVSRHNRYYQDPEVVKTYESSRPMEETFPVDTWEVTLAKVTLLGVLRDGKEERVTIPPSPGQDVEEVKSEHLKKLLGFVDSGIRLGKLMFHDLDVVLDVTKLLQKHLAILSISGGGKSYTTSVILEELLDLDKSPAIVVVDPHGEYVGFAEDEKYAHKVRVFKKDDIIIGASNLTAHQLFEMYPGMSKVQRTELENVINSLRETRLSYGMDDLIQEVKNSSMEERTKRAILRWLEDLKRTGLVGNVDKPSIEELARIGGMSILDLSGFVDLRKKQMIVTHIAKKLFDARRQGKVPPFILVVEEAHQFAPEGKEREKALSKEIIETIAREGRKFYASLVIISQRPIKLSTTALSQCNTMIVLRVTNPYDIEHISKSAEGMTSDLEEILPSLRVGEAVVFGEAVNYPILVRIRKRKSKEARGIGTFQQAVEAYLKENDKKEELLDAF